MIPNKMTPFGETGDRVVWSRYNILFQSRSHGWLLFNTVSCAFLSVPDDQVLLLEGIRKDPEGFDYSSCPLLYIQLRSMGVLTEQKKDESYYAIAKMRSLTQLYGDGTLSLTVAVTRACNFDCSYCFEGNRTGSPMCQEAEDRLIRFIAAHKARQLYITWYGGEPLLAFDRILSIDKRIRETGKPIFASMITNGYLLTEEKIQKLNGLGIGYLQITLDGGKETHDSRRYLKNGGGSYDVILRNIENLMASDFKGVLHIRVNVDGRNDDEFADVYRYFSSRYPAEFGGRIRVYPGFVKGDGPESGCFFDSAQRGAFLARMYRTHGIIPLSIFPTHATQSCTMTHRNSFVVGPDGELYKCWDDVGISERVVGTLELKNDWDMAQIADGMVTSSYLESSECRDCLYFPVCDGGCPRVRQKNLRDGRQESTCTYFKENMEELLELWYEKRLAEAARAKETLNNG
ncbi:MAG: radical SAM protein [Clostridia bacterium]|nr:radical SAM protein [Clostridia bacterium]